MRAFAARGMVLASGATPERPTATARVLKLAQLKAEREKLPALFAEHLERLNLTPLFVREYRFHPERKWRLDFYCAAYHLGVELHGGVYSKGRHVRPKGFEEDCAKKAAALDIGISVYEFTAEQLKREEDIPHLQQFFGGRTQ